MCIWLMSVTQRVRAVWLAIPCNVFACWPRRAGRANQQQSLHGGEAGSQGPAARIALLCGSGAFSIAAVATGAIADEAWKC